MAETEPLLKHSSSSDEKPRYDVVTSIDDDAVRLKRHITLPYAVAIIVGNVIGSGIFLSPKGVTANIGSVGGSLIIWGVTGVYNLAQALCYAELGCVIPRSGGDYAYLYYTLGPLAAFMCAWIHVVIIASSSCAVIARTAALYLIQPLGLQCYTGLITLIAVLVIGRFSGVYVSCSHQDSGQYWQLEQEAKKWYKPRSESSKPRPKLPIWLIDCITELLVVISTPRTLYTSQDLLG